MIFSILEVKKIIFLVEKIFSPENPKNLKCQKKVSRKEIWAWKHNILGQIGSSRRCKGQKLTFWVNPFWWSWLATAARDLFIVIRIGPIWRPILSLVTLQIFDQKSFADPTIEKSTKIFKKVRKNGDSKKRIFRPISPFLSEIWPFSCFWPKSSLVTMKTSMPFLQTHLPKPNFSWRAQKMNI